MLPSCSIRYSLRQSQELEVTGAAPHEKDFSGVGDVWDDGDPTCQAILGLALSLTTSHVRCPTDLGLGLGRGCRLPLI